MHTQNKKSVLKIFYFHSMKWMSLLIFCCTIWVSCNEEAYPKAENAFDAAREFIDACLKGNFDKAAFYIKKDVQNEAELEKLKTNYKRKKDSEKQQYREASIIILEEETIEVDTHIINYKNSYDNIVRKIKTVRQEGIWLIDLKYTFTGNL